MSSETSAAARDAGDAQSANREVLAGAVAACADQFAELVAGLFAESGMDRETGAKALERAAARLRSGSATLPATTEYPWVQLGDALSMWWRDEAYLDDRGRPRELPTHGPAPSLDDLFARTIDPPLWDAARALLARTTAREHNGMWTVTKDSPVLHLDGHESAQRILFYLTGGLNSWVDNLLRQHDHTRSKNVDRGSVNAAFPEALLPELRSKLHKRMTTVLGEIDSWMTYQSQTYKDGPVVLVGLDFMMHASPPRPRRGRLRRLKRRRQTFRERRRAQAAQARHQGRVRADEGGDRSRRHLARAGAPRSRESVPRLRGNDGVRRQRRASRIRLARRGREAECGGRRSACMDAAE